MNIEPEPRIGDREREAAASAMGEHFAAGRITREEYDERVTRVWSAQTNADLRPLFADLPGPPGPGASQPQRPVRGGAGIPFLPVLLIALVVGAVSDSLFAFLLVLAAAFWLGRSLRSGFLRAPWSLHGCRGQSSHQPSRRH